MKGLHKSVVVIATVLLFVAIIIVPGKAREPSDKGFIWQSISWFDLGTKWPLKSIGGWIGCNRRGDVVFFVKGITYALNGQARHRYRAINPIWLADPKWKNYPGGQHLKMDIGPLLNAGLQLCR